MLSPLRKNLNSVSLALGSINTRQATGLEDLVLLMCILKCIIMHVVYYNLYFHEASVRPNGRESAGRVICLVFLGDKNVANILILLVVHLAVRTQAV